MRTFLLMSILGGAISTNSFATPTPNSILCQSFNGALTVSYDAFVNDLGQSNKKLTLKAAESAHLQDLTGEVSVVENDINIGTQYTMIMDSSNATNAITLVVPSDAPISKTGELQAFDALLVWKTSFTTPGSLTDFKYIALLCVGLEVPSI